MIRGGRGQDGLLGQRGPDHLIDGPGHLEASYGKLGDDVIKITGLRSQAEGGGGDDRILASYGKNARSRPMQPRKVRNRLHRPS